MRLTQPPQRATLLCTALCCTELGRLFGGWRQVYNAGAVRCPLLTQRRRPVKLSLMLALLPRIAPAATKSAPPPPNPQKN